MEAMSSSGCGLKAVKWVITPGTHLSELQVLCKMESPLLRRAAVTTVSHGTLHSACGECSISPLIVETRAAER